MSAGPRGPTAGRDVAGPPAPDPDPSAVLRDAAITEARSLAAYLSERPMRTQPTLARVAKVLGQLANLVEAGAAVPAPPAGPCLHPNWLPPVDAGGTYVCERCGVERAGAPPAGLTVARLAALLAESPLRVPLDGWEWDEPTPEAATWPEHLAAWLLPRLGPVSPGAPAVVRRAPTDAMIEAAFRVLDGLDGRRRTHPVEAKFVRDTKRWAVIAEALRAALAAQDRT